MSSAATKPPDAGGRSPIRAEGEHLKICPGCGEIFNAADRAQRDHHASPDHRPQLLSRDR